MDDFPLRDCFKSCHEASKTPRYHKEILKNLVSWGLCGKDLGLSKQLLKKKSIIVPDEFRLHK
jgi:hypothetical protein